MNKLSPNLMAYSLIVLDEDGYSEVTESADDEKKQPSEVDEYEMYEDLGEVYDSPKAPSQTDVTAKGLNFQFDD